MLGTMDKLDTSEYDVEDINRASFALIFPVLAKCVMQLSAVNPSPPLEAYTGMLGAGGKLLFSPSLLPSPPPLLKDESQDCTPPPNLAALEAVESSHLLSWSLTPSLTPQHSNCASGLSALSEARWK